MPRTITFPLRKVCSALPAVALISVGIVLPASATPTDDPRLGLISSQGPAVVVPDIAMIPPGSEGIVVDHPNLHAPSAPAPRPLLSMLPAGSPTAVTLDSRGIPVRALERYQKAASLIGPADPTCNIDWALVAAIGRVESNHARFGGNQLDSSGTARPGIIGIPLDGANGTALITDSDRGLLDQDLTYDRAVGPMQFIPSTWRVAGVDGDGDGVKNPQNMADAATATAVYLCSGPGDLRRTADLRAAILRYNASDSYVQMVTSIADAYRHGVSDIASFDLAAMSPTTPATPANPATDSAPASPALGQAGSTQTKASGQPPAPTPRAPTTIPRSSVPTVPLPASTPPRTSAPTQATSTQGTATPTPTSTPAPSSTPAPTTASRPPKGPGSTV